MVNRISLRQSRNITFATGKNITPNKVRYITKNNENAVVCECEIASNGVGQGLAAAEGWRFMHDGLRLLSNENASRIKPSSDEEGGTPQA